MSIQSPLFRVRSFYLNHLIADFYYAILLMWNESFANLPADVKSVFYACCREYGLNSQIQEVWNGLESKEQAIGYSIKSSNRERKQHLEIEKRLSALEVPILPTSTLLTVKAIESCFITYSLSQESLTMQTDAILLLDRVMNSMGSPDKKQLQDCVHMMCSDLDSPQSIATLLLAFILTFVPILSVRTFPLPNRNQSPQPPSSFQEARYVVWKTITCFFRSCQWSVRIIDRSET